MSCWNGSSYILELEGALVMLLAQTRRDRKETRVCHSLALNMKHTLEFVFVLYARWIWNTHWRVCFYWTICDAVLSTCQTAAQTHAVWCLFCQLRKWPPACMRGCVYRPVRPLVLIYNSIWKHHYKGPRPGSLRSNMLLPYKHLKLLKAHSFKST